MDWAKLFCWHRWKQNIPFDGTEGSPSVIYREWWRSCEKCGKTQRWLPGYGGSEWGCWLNQDWNPDSK